MSEGHNTKSQRKLKVKELLSWNLTGIDSDLLLLPL